MAKFSNNVYSAEGLYGSTHKPLTSCYETLQNGRRWLYRYSFQTAWLPHCCLLLYFVCAIIFSPYKDPQTEVCPKIIITFTPSHSVWLISQFVRGRLFFDSPVVSLQLFLQQLRIKALKKQMTTCTPNKRHAMWVMGIAQQAKDHLWELLTVVSLPFDLHLEEEGLC